MEALDGKNERLAKSKCVRAAQGTTPDPLQEPTRLRSLIGVHSRQFVVENVSRVAADKREESEMNQTGHERKALISVAA